MLVMEVGKATQCETVSRDTAPWLGAFFLFCLVSRHTLRAKFCDLPQPGVQLNFDSGCVCSSKLKKEQSGSLGVGQP